MSKETARVSDNYWKLEGARKALPLELPGEERTALPPISANETVNCKTRSLSGFKPPDLYSLHASSVVGSNHTVCTATVESIPE